MALSQEMLGEKQRFSRKQAALQQIHTAIHLFNSRDFACAITLALAAEEQVPIPDAPYLFKLIKDRAPDAMDGFNLVRNWLKHCMPPEEIDLFEFEVVIALARAITKFIAAHRESTTEIETFIQWSRDRGYLSKKEEK